MCAAMYVKFVCCTHSPEKRALGDGEFGLDPINRYTVIYLESNNGDGEFGECHVR